MDDIRIGTVFRSARQARRWRQKDLEAKSGVSQSAISRIECGQIGPQSIDSLRAVGGALDIRIDILPRWHGGDLDRLLNSAHSQLHESVARWFRDTLPEWVLAPEVSFSIYGERGVIDILAWHPGRRALLVIELKTDIVDVNELVGTFDRKRRLAARVAKERGWDALTVSAWLIVSESRTSRRRVAAHAGMLHGALPDHRGKMQRWLREPVGSVAGVSFWPYTRATGTGRAQRPIRRVRRPTTGVRERVRRPSSRGSDAKP
jgi:transcriptional regulator with XRE-family HTH domain